MKSIHKRLMTAFLSLLLITAMTTAILSGIYAGYSTSSTASVTATVAVFQIDGDNMNLDGYFGDEEKMGELYEMFGDSNKAQIDTLVGAGDVIILSNSDTVIDTASSSDNKGSAAFYYMISNKLGEQLTEVDVSYKIEVILSEDLPYKTELSVQDLSNQEITNTRSEADGKVIYTFEPQHWTFTANEEQNNFIKISFESDNSNNDALPTDDSGIDVTIRITASQIIDN